MASPTKRPLFTQIYVYHGKRLFDFVLASGLFIVFSPLTLICALAIRLAMGRPILFQQQRTGRGGAIFTIYKFRTMRADDPSANQPLSDSERITPLGHRLRRMHLDELPQLINILRGDMSLVGPRPLLPQYLDRYTAIQARRHEVRPGLTGWAQIHGANQLSWDEKFQLDVWYVDNLSLRVDLNILWRTFLIALRSVFSSRPEALASEFKPPTMSESDRASGDATSKQMGDR